MTPFEGIGLLAACGLIAIAGGIWYVSSIIRRAADQHIIGIQAICDLLREERPR